MSILLPADSPARGNNRRKVADRGTSQPLFARLRGISLLQMLFKEQDKPSQSETIAPTGKLRLVTSRWVDRPQKTRAKETHSPR